MTLLLAGAIAGCADAGPTCGPAERLAGQLSSAPEAEGAPLVVLLAYNDHGARDATFCVRVHPGGTYVLALESRPNGHQVREMARGHLAGETLRVEAWLGGTDLRVERSWTLEPENHVVARFTGEGKLELERFTEQPAFA